MATELLTTDQLSAETGIPVSTFEYWRCYGGGPAVTKLGRRVRYTRASVDKWLKARTAQPSSRRRRAA